MGDLDAVLVRNLLGDSAQLTGTVPSIRFLSTPSQSRQLAPLPQLLVEPNRRSRKGVPVRPRRIRFGGS
ncbi:hypothetical protein SEA_SHAGRAT_81 [Rhodococcus phage Shagrat]|nr:hypothetical protein SEA_SHAGRAT_81 [Rhodococcus phage Shagrat]